MEVKIYFAPLEGITGYIYRNVYEEHFGKGKIDKYFIPFIAPNKNKSFTSMNMNNIMPEHNIKLNAIPQILTADAAQFIDTALMLRDYGYTQINLNLGCPSPTVVTKGKGSGFLSDADKLRSFFDDIFSSGIFKTNKACDIHYMTAEDDCGNNVKNGNTGLELSVKTRIGVNDVSEVYDIFKVYNEYYFDEIIVHPRIQKEFYKGKPHFDIYEELVQMSSNRLCYNSDIFTMTDWEAFKEQFPMQDTVMLGRGLIANPQFIDDITASTKAACPEYDMERLRHFHDRLLNDYSKVMSGDVNVLHKMKELWFYMGKSLSGCDKYLKSIKKSRHMSDYKAAADMIFSNGTISRREHITF